MFIDHVLFGAPRREVSHPCARPGSRIRQSERIIHAVSLEAAEYRVSFIVTLRREGIEAQLMLGRGFREATAPL
jgi:hypothetical protein